MAETVATNSGTVERDGELHQPARRRALSQGTLNLEPKAPHLFDSLPANFETKQDRIDERKPALHQRLATS